MCFSIVGRRLSPLNRVFFSTMKVDKPLHKAGKQSRRCQTTESGATFCWACRCDRNERFFKADCFFSFFLVWSQGRGGGTSASLLKQTRAVIDANRVISLYLKGVADSRSIKVKSAPLVTGVIYYCQKQTNNVACQGDGGEGVGVVLISPDVMCEAHFRNYP